MSKYKSFSVAILPIVTSLLMIGFVGAQTTLPTVSPTPVLTLTPTPSVEERLLLLESQTSELAESMGTPNKDIWDKLESVSGWVSGGLIALIGLIATYVYQERQRKTEQKNNEQSQFLSRIEILQSFIPLLQSEDERVVATAVKVMSLMDSELATDVGVLFASKGGTSALVDLLASPDPTTVNQANKALNTVFDTLRKTVVQVAVGGDQIRGCGFIVKPEGYLLTADFVVSDSKDIRVIIEDKTYKVQLINSDKESSLALLKVDEGAFAALPINAGWEVDYLDRVLVLGYDPALGWKVSKGQVIGTQIDLEGHPGQSFINTDIVVSPGYAGAPVINSNGQVIGMIVMTHVHPYTQERTTLLVPVATITKFIQDSLKV